jgi:hypothetical protein
MERIAKRNASKKSDSTSHSQTGTARAPFTPLHYLPLLLQCHPQSLASGRPLRCCCMEEGDDDSEAKCGMGSTNVKRTCFSCMYHFCGLLVAAGCCAVDCSQFRFQFRFQLPILCQTRRQAAPLKFPPSPTQSLTQLATPSPWPSPPLPSMPIASA